MADHDSIKQSLRVRFNQDFSIDADQPGVALLASMAAHGSCRRFKDRRVNDELIRMLCAVALSSPSKSDLQQRDVIIVSDPAVKSQLVDLLAGQAWIKGAPHLLVFCGNNRRQRQIHQWRELPFVNDHLDAFFNAAVDAGIALSAFVSAADASGLGCCPISAIRNEATKVSELLGLPDHVFPVAGLALGYPQSSPAEISPRLPIDVTVHTDRFNEHNVEQQVSQYDASRRAVQPYQTQRLAKTLGPKPDYGWSDDKARQYSVPERADFGDYVLRKGFLLK
jgi:nitroreductase/FMN reductase [NAD(P)H]